MVSSPFAEKCDAALNDIGNRLGEITREFGPSDFPHDKGAGLRNYLLTYPYALFRAMQYCLDEEPNDPWASANSNAMNLISIDSLAKVAGCCQFAVEMRKFSDWSPKDSAEAAHKYKLLQVTLDWLTNAYQTSPDVPIGWYNAVAKYRSHEEYIAVEEQLLLKGLSQPLMREWNKIDEPWLGLAFSGSLSRPNSKEAWWIEACNQFFGER